MSPVVYLHVGAPKTGTTYLQDRLARNRRSLARHGVHYPLGLHSSHFLAALDLIERDWGGQHPDVAGHWDALAAKVRELDGTVVVSHEILAGATPAQVARARSTLEGCELHVVYSARDVARQVPAEWQEGLKHRRQASFARFVRKVRRSPVRGSSLWFWQAQGLPDVLDRWGAGLPPQRVHLVTVPQRGAPRDLLWHRYCEALGIDPAWAPDDAARENVSIGVAEAAVLRRLNRRLKKTGISPDDYARLIRHRVVHDSLARRQGMTPVTLPPRLFGWAAEVAESWVQYVERSGVDVVGDVADLRPVPPPADARWRNPDKPRRSDMLDVSLDVMVALTREAARTSTVRERLSRAGGLLRRLGRR